MKKTMGAIALYIIMAISAYAQDQDAAPENGSTGNTVLEASQTQPAAETPVKKMPAAENSFELIEGKRIQGPMDAPRFSAAAEKAAKRMGWKIIGSENGVLHLRLQRRNWWVQIAVCFNENEYWYQYTDSFNIGANLEKNSIYYGYYKWWIPNLDKAIQSFYKEKT